MVTTNPYQMPNANLDGPRADQPYGPAITAATVEYFSQTRPWVLFLAILGFIGAGLVAAGALVALLGGTVGAAMGHGDARSGALAAAGMGVGYLIMGLLYFFPSFFLMKYAMAIGRIRTSNGSTALEEALAHQKSFWRFVGITALVVLALYALAVVAVVIAAVVAA